MHGLIGYLSSYSSRNVRVFKQKLGRIKKWFVTPEARYKIGILTTITTCSTFAITYLPKTIFINEYCEFVALRKNNEPIPITPKMKKIWDQVLNDLKLSEYHRMILKPFVVFGFDAKGAGSLKSQYGSIIGFPINYTSNSVDTIDKTNIMAYGEPIDWDMEEAKILLDSLILSDDAQKYAIAREILMTDNSSLLINSMLNCFFMGIPYGVCANLNDSFQLLKKPSSVRYTIYGLATLFIWGVWILQKDFFSTLTQSETDDKLSQMSVNYVKGAIEFYSKLLERNKAIRSLLGSKGEYFLTAEGDDRILFRMKSLPHTDRKKYFEKKLKELETSTSQNTIELVSSKLNIA